MHDHTLYVVEKTDKRKSSENGKNSLAAVHHKTPFSFRLKLRKLDEYTFSLESAQTTELNELFIVFTRRSLFYDLTKKK